MYKILVINPGSTSTKVGFFEDEREILRETITHDAVFLSKFERIFDQYEFRKSAVVDFLNRNHIDLKELSAVVGRGGIIHPVSAGTYLVNEKMIEDSKNSPIEHASNLGAVIAYEIAKPLGIPAFIVDPVVVDEFIPLARISGLKEIERKSRLHALNMRRVAIQRAKEKGGKLSDFNFIVGHIGGGISIAPFMKGRIVDVNDASSGGPFSPERSGGLPSGDLVKMCFSGKYTKKEIKKKIMGKGGVVAYLGTNDMREVERRIEEGDDFAKLIFEAMAYQIAKEIGADATVLKGDVDEIILTGGVVNSKRLVELIKERVSFIAPIVLFPGEKELEALALGALRVLRGEEEAKIYT